VQSNTRIGRRENCVINDRCRYSVGRVIDTVVRRYHDNVSPGSKEIHTDYAGLLAYALSLACPCEGHWAMELPTEIGRRSGKRRYSIINPQMRNRVRATLIRLDANLAIDRQRFVDLRRRDELSPETRTAEFDLAQVLRDLIRVRPRFDAAETAATARPLRKLLSLGLTPMLAEVGSRLIGAVYGRHYRSAAHFGAPSPDTLGLALYLQDTVMINVAASRRQNRDSTPSYAVLELLVTDLSVVADLIVEARNAIQDADPGLWLEFESECRAMLTESLEAACFSDDGRYIDADPIATSPVAGIKWASTASAAIEPEQQLVRSLIDIDTGGSHPYRALFRLFERHIETGTPEVIQWITEWVLGGGGTVAADAVFARWLRGGQIAKRTVGESNSAKLLRAAAADPDPEALRVVVTRSRALLIELQVEQSLGTRAQQHLS